MDKNETIDEYYKRLIKHMGGNIEYLYNVTLSDVLQTGGPFPCSLLNKIILI